METKREAEPLVRASPHPVVVSWRVRLSIAEGATEIDCGFIPVGTEFVGQSRPRTLERHA
jgi:hypothetical protein